MKSVFILFACIATLSSLCFADVPDPVWTRTAGTDAYEEAFAICRLQSGDILIGGRQYGPASISTSPMVVRMTITGETVWTITSTSPYGNDSSTVYGLCGTTDGGFLAAGSGRTYYAYYGLPFVTRFSANGDTTWNVRYSSWSGMQIGGLTQMPDNGFAVIGTRQPGWNTPNVMFFGRLGTGGGIRWTRSFGSDSWAHGNAVLAMPDTGCVLAGCLGASIIDSTSASGYFVRLNSHGDTVWTQTYGTTGYNEFQSVDRTSDGGFILAGFTTAFGNGNRDAWVVRTDAAGHMVWQAHFGGPQDETAYDVKTVDGGYLIAGRVYVSDSLNYDGYMVRVRENGAADWAGNVGGNQFDEFRQMVTTPDGGFIVAGTTNSFGAGLADFYVLRFPPGSGWVGTVTDRTSRRGLPNVTVAIPARNQRCVTDSRGFYQLLVPPGTYDLITYGACTTRDTIRNAHVALSVVDTLNWIVDQPQDNITQSSLNLVVHNHVVSSTPLVIRNVGPGLMDYSLSISTSYPRGNWLTAVPSSGSLAAGDSITVSVNVHADTTDNTILDYYGAITVHDNSCPDTVHWIAVFATVLDAEDRPTTLPRAFSLAAYPNPFNPSTTISFTLPQRESVSLSLYDISGRQVSVLREGMMDAGTYHETFDGSRLPSGIYFARLQTPTHNQTRKLMLLK